MATFKIYKLHFISPLHLGDARDDYGVSLQTIASDTMYAALTSCLAKLGNTIPDNGDLNCTISSLFPFYQKDEKCENTVLFFPKPLKQKLPALDNIDDRKKIKKVSWIDAAFFSKVLNGETLFVKGSDDVNCIKGSFLTSKDVDKDFIVSQVSQRVSVSRDGQTDAEPFYMDRVSFKGKSGLFFISEGDCTLLERALKLLQFEGIGTDRNVGNGFFTYEPDSFEIELPDSSDFALSLSSFIPESKAQLTDLISDDSVAYEFQRRGGWITTPPFNTFRKNVVYAFVSGSVFKKAISSAEVMGNIVNLKPKSVPAHAIWRCGKSIFLPIKF